MSQSNNNSNTMLSQQFAVFGGINLQVDEGCAEDYLHMRARQLAALAQIMASESFFCRSKPIKVNVASLMSSLADEVDNLVPLAIQEARKSQG